MDWTWIHTTAIVVLNNLVLWIWKPWMNAYAGEKGKNLARKDDLDKILAEVRAVTITQREIEARISGELWKQQWALGQKRLLYGRLLTVLEECREAFTDCVTAYDQIHANPGRVHPRQIVELVERALKRFSRFKRIAAECRLLLGNQTVDLIATIEKDHLSLESLQEAMRPETDGIEFIKRSVVRFSQCKAQIIELGRKEFGT